ncbi:MAG: RNA polymerase sigma factor [Armatimonadetes bacterium]|nr:RNA polymerase sigma factor [Armatimonadota bacterium]
MTVSPDSDLALVQSFLDGNPEAFDRLFLKYQDYVFNICLGILGNPDDARDCAQETFVRIYRKAGEFRGRAAFSTWIYRIAVNVCVGALRKRPRTAVASLEDDHVREAPDGSAPPWHGLQQKDDERLVRQVVTALIPDYRLVLVLRYFQGLSYEEIAQVLGWTLPQVKIKLHRARRSFAARYAACLEGADCAADQAASRSP